MVRNIENKEKKLEVAFKNKKLKIPYFQYF